MSTQTDEVIIPQKPRGIRELLRLDTYQDMSDEEIELVIEYQKQQAMFSQEMLTKVEASIVRNETLLAIERENAQHARDMLESIVAKGMPDVPSAELKTFQPVVTQNKTVEYDTEVSNG